MMPSLKFGLLTGFLPHASDILINMLSTTPSFRLIFAMMNNMGVELFELPWVQAVTDFFGYLGWTLFVVGIAVGAFECAIEYQGGRGSVRVLRHQNVCCMPFPGCSCTISIS